MRFRDGQLQTSSKLGEIALNNCFYLRDSDPFQTVLKLITNS